ncbi:hypothetical protein BD309DRAFT_312836 [Dichomitus squalens]|nr:hypothetical protein BD309DRAFT_312836 [Dichomitus squalens]
MSSVIPVSALTAPVAGVDVFIALAALLYYDWILCLGSEISLVWNGHNRRTWASLVYALSRYPILVFYAFVIMSFFPVSALVPSDSTCV